MWAEQTLKFRGYEQQQYDIRGKTKSHGRQMRSKPLSRKNQGETLQPANYTLWE